MAGRPLQALGRVLFWRYPRGGWQYDVLCAAIIAFIFLTPKGVFDGSYFRDAERNAPESVTLDGDGGSAERTEEGRKPSPSTADENR
jgi:hypothetical protein